jgi:hypothetical protein
MKSQGLMSHVQARMSRFGLLVLFLLVARTGAGCSSSQSAGTPQPDTQSSTTRVSYRCGTGDASPLCHVGESFCELDTGGGPGGAPGHSDGGDGVGAASAGTSHTGMCQPLPSGCAGVPSCDCICAFLGCPPSPPPGCTCHGTDGQLELDCLWE